MYFFTFICIIHVAVQDTTKPKTETAKPPVGEFQLDLSVENPEIILVENSMDVNTKAFVLDVSMGISTVNAARTRN